MESPERIRRRRCVRERLGRRRAALPSRFHAPIAVFHRGHGLQRQMCALFSGKRGIHPGCAVCCWACTVCGEEQQSRQPIEPFPKEAAPVEITWLKRGWLIFLFSVHVSAESFYIMEFIAISWKQEEHIGSGCVQWNHLRIVLVAPGHPSPSNWSSTMWATSLR